MLVTYKLNRPFIGTEPDSVTKTTEDGIVSIIPFNESNMDYLKYLTWIDEGNTPEPMDEP